MSKTVLKIGVLGAGFIGGKHIDAYPFVEHAKVTAVADKRSEKAEELAARVGARTYQTLEEMIEAEDLDCIDVGLPSKLHKEAVLMALETGHHVLVEKPFATNLEDIDAMIKTVRKSGKRLMVAHVCRFMPEYMHAKEVIESGKLGRTLYFGAWRESPTPDWSWNNWLFDRELSGGTVLDLSIHDIDLSNWYLGRPKRFYAHEVTKNGGKGPSHVVSNIDYAGGSVSSIEAGHLMPKSYPFTSGFRLVFEKGAIECEARAPEYNYVTVFTDKGITNITADQLPAVTGNNPYAAEISHFIGCILNDEEFTVSMAEARLAVESVLKLSRSIESKNTEIYDL